MVWCVVLLCEIISLEMFDSAEDVGIIKTIIYILIKYVNANEYQEYSRGGGR
jgi:hypothetical protein